MGLLPHTLLLCSLPEVSGLCSCFSRCSTARDDGPANGHGRAESHACRFWLVLFSRTANSC